MAAAIFHGKAANAYWDDSGYTAFTNLTEWSCTITADTAESHVMNATNYGKTREVGFKTGTATVVCRVSGDQQVDEGVNATLILRRDATNTSKGYRGPAICTGVDIGVDMNDVEIITYTFQFTSTIQNTVAITG